MSTLLNWARQQSWWNVAQALLEQSSMGTIMHVQEELPEGLSLLTNKRTGSFIKFTQCKHSMHILLSVDAEIAKSVLDALEKLPPGGRPHHDPTELPGFRQHGWKSEVGDA